MGSPATSAYLEPLLPLLREYDARIVGDPRVGEAWHEETETQTLRDFGIGVMPLPDNAWTRGKCGFKALQYMAAGAVPVVSPVGVNSRIVQHLENGWLAAADADWRDALRQLTADSMLRQRLARAARQTVVAHWSLAAWRDRWVTAVEEA